MILSKIKFNSNGPKDRRTLTNSYICISISCTQKHTHTHTHKGDGRFLSLSDLVLPPIMPNICPREIKSKGISSHYSPAPFRSLITFCVKQVFWPLKDIWLHHRNVEYSPIASLNAFFFKNLVICLGPTQQPTTDRRKKYDLRISTLFFFEIEIAYNYILIEK